MSGHDDPTGSHGTRLTASARVMLVVAAVAALVLGGVVGFLSLQEDQGNVVRTGTPWVAAAFANLESTLFGGHGWL